jgi:hypothetical protein
MRLLVLSLPRTGSTSFSKDLAEKNNLTFVFEPFAPNAPKFNKLKNFGIDHTKNNVVVKTLVNDEYDIEWFINLSKDFDATYLLTRKDLNGCIESWAYLNHKRVEVPGFDFETEYYWEKTPNYEESEVQIHRWDNKLRLIATKLNLEVLYYEEVFGYNNNKLRKGDKKSNKRPIL